MSFPIVIILPRACADSADHFRNPVGWANVEYHRARMDGQGSPRSDIIKIIKSENRRRPVDANNGKRTVSDAVLETRPVG